MDTIKKELRRKAKSLRDSITPLMHQKKSFAAAAYFLESELYKKAGTIFSYLPIGSELDTLPILEQAWQDGKTVAVPITKEDRQMYFVSLGSIAEVKAGRYGIPEPQKGKEEEIIPKEEDIFLVPALLFDRVGNRLGYGGGYYDTYFAFHRMGARVGICFKVQIFSETLPVEKTDLAVEKIITEEGWMGG